MKRTRKKVFDFRANTGVEHYKERTIPAGCEARDAARLLGPGWTAKSDKYLRDDGCCLCYAGEVVERFRSWEDLIARVEQRRKG